MSTRISFYQRGILTKLRDEGDKNGIAFGVGSASTRDSLLKKGLIERMLDTCGCGYRGYRITDAGRIALEPIIKECSCKREYTKTSWKLLDFVSFYDDNAPAIPEHPEFGEPKGRCEMRNCVCGSSIIVPLTTLEEKVEVP